MPGRRPSSASSETGADERLWPWDVLPPTAITWLLLAVPLAFLLVFFVYPLQGIVRESFFREGSALSSVKPLVTNPYFGQRAWFTLWQATASTVLTLLVAMPLAYVFAKHDFPGKSLVVALVTVPFVLPTIVVAVMFAALAGPQGALNALLERLFGLDSPPIALMSTVWIILAAHVFYNFGMAARIIASGWATLDERMEDVAAVLGSGRVERFFRVTLPLLRPAILAAGSLVFLFCFTSFGVVLVLGGPRYNTIETEIYRETAFLFQLPLAAVLALLQLLFMFLVMAAYTHFQTRTSTTASPLNRARARRKGERWFAAGVVAVALALVLIPMAALVERSLHSAHGYTFEFYRALGRNTNDSAIFTTPRAAVEHSVGFALLTLAISVPIGTLAAYGSLRFRRYGAWVEALLLMPLGVSAITLALGFIVTLDSGPLDLRGSWWLIVIAHTLAAYPFVTRAVGVPLRTMDPHLREAARTLGAGPLRVFATIDLPLIWRSIVVGGVFAIATSIGEFGATLLIARPDWTTLPIAIYRYFGRPGSVNYGEGLAMSVILMAVTAAGFVVIDRLRIRGLAAL
ncbi:MAG TPA: iron ABC transporter permease [Tepidiformaceae bacterium]|nr:iron ABC transporter permease [Tepidiformaceae bacterium]